MFEPERSHDESLNESESNLNFSIAAEPRWRSLFSNLKTVLLKTVVSGISATPAESDLLLASTLWYSTLLGNLKSVLLKSHQPKVSAHPVETHLLLENRFQIQDLWENLRETFRRTITERKGVTAQPVQTDLLLELRPWFKTIFRELPLFFGPRPVYVLSAQPVVVDPLFREYRFRKRSVAFSVMTHFLLVAAILWLPSWISRSGAPAAKPQLVTQLMTPLILNLPPKAQKSGGGGGGGRREKLPASLGKLPKFSNQQLTPPTPKIVNLDPVLPVEPTVVVPQLAQLPAVNMTNLGDPLGIPGPPSSGPGEGGGIGTGKGTGVGPGNGPGVGPGSGGGFGGGPFRVGGGVSAPAVVYRVEPEYSEEARRARYQGSVVLSAIVRKDGTIEILKVIRGLGLGLDESAIVALRQWKFRPGMNAGMPVDVALNVEINFALR